MQLLSVSAATSASVLFRLKNFFDGLCHVFLIRMTHRFQSAFLASATRILRSLTSFVLPHTQKLPLILLFFFVLCIHKFYNSENSIKLQKSN